MKLPILLNFLLITVIIAAPHKHSRRKPPGYDELRSNYDSYESSDICDNFVHNRRYEVDCRHDAQTISLKLKTELGSISVAKSFETTNAERKHSKRTHVHRYQGETYNSDANSFSTSINLPHSSLSFTKSYKKVSGC
ncbi:hypothetical protein KPH14_003785 [Odynerus spinipes]|uniref:Uncharacterized protein n=1 Tax=Odynerus spinipes TaxID=1348599 RepID=A0AAD9RXB0_9HYME|nr:hypothetical protein KPH14_003785 [Odynerus spinipes]